MIRRLLTLVAALSLLLCLATAVLWVRSYWVADGFLRRSGAWTVFTGASRGTLCELRTVPLPDRSVGLTFGYRRQPAYPVTRHRPLTGEPGVRHHGGALGFEWFVTDGGTSNTIKMPGRPAGMLWTATFAPARQFYVPLWSLALLFALPPAAWLAIWRHRRRQRLLQREGRCRKCGYDLRATPDRCPECGTVARESGKRGSATFVMRDS